MRIKLDVLCFVLNISCFGFLLAFSLGHFGAEHGPENPSLLLSTCRAFLVYRIECWFCASFPHNLYTFQADINLESLTLQACCLLTLQSDSNSEILPRESWYNAQVRYSARVSGRWIFCAVGFGFWVHGNWSGAYAITCVISLRWTSDCRFG